MAHSVFRRLLLSLVLPLGLGVSLGSGAASVKTEHVEAELIAEQASIQPGKPFTVALRIKHAPHWHTYWRNPGDSGLATKIAWNLPKDFTAGPIQWPHPKRLPLGPLMNFGYENELLLLTEITPPAGLKPGGAVDVSAKADWLVCKDVCIPENGQVDLKLPVRDEAPAKSIWASGFASARASLPVAAQGWAFASAVQGKSVVVQMTPEKGTSHQPKDVFFYPYQEGVMENALPQPVKSEGGRLALTAQLTDPVAADLKVVPGILVSQNGWGGTTAKAVLVGTDPGQSNVMPAAFTASAALTKPPAPSAPIAPATPPGSDLGLWLALLFAFIGGLILNLMPCVFPVLGIKVMSFVQHAHEDRRILRNQGLVFLAGVVVSFWVLAGILLALKAGGQSLGWGFQLQSPAFVTVLAVLFTLMALNLFGVFEIGLGLQSAAGSVSGKGIYSEAFLSGVLATVVATPCTAPFMGAALGFTLSQPAVIAVLVFTVLALGMAAPIVLLALFPAGLKWLPRPGAWMATFKQFMAFPLLATVVWLTWVLGTQQGNDGVLKLLAGLVLIGMAAWAYGRWGMQGSKFGMAFAAVLLAGGVVFAWPGEANVTTQAGSSQAKAGELPWEPWSKAKLEQLLGEGKPVFVDFTASWCITCQVNKRVALHNGAVVKRFAERGVIALKADWTRQDPAITAALAEFGRNAVPLYVMYGGNGAAPVVLPEVLTPALMLTELDKVGKPDATGAGQRTAAK